MAEKGIFFICNDESINTYGFVVKTDGIDLSAFQKNPVMLWNHGRSTGSDEREVLPIGRWEGMKKEAGQLTGRAVFDLNDPFARKIAEKVEKGFISACSIGIRILERDDNPTHWAEGQIAPTVTRCELREISVCDIPANRNAVTVSLYDAGGKVVELSDVPGMAVSPFEAQNRRIAAALGLEWNAGTEEVLKAAEALKKAKDELQEREAAEMERMLSEAVRKRKISALKLDIFREMGRKNGLNVLRDVLADMAEPVSTFDLVRGWERERREKRERGRGKPRSEWELEDYRKHDPKALQDDPKLYKRLLDEQERKKPVSPYELPPYYYGD